MFIFKLLAVLCSPVTRIKCLHSTFLQTTFTFVHVISAFIRNITFTSQLLETLNMCCHARNHRILQNKMQGHFSAMFVATKQDILMRDHDSFATEPKHDLLLGLGLIKKKIRMPQYRFLNKTFYDTNFRKSVWNKRLYYLHTWWASRQPITSTIRSWHHKHAAYLLAHWPWRD